jgi:hypothetical protein
MLILIEFGLVVVAIALAFWFPRLGANPMSKIERAFARIARNRKRSVLLVGLAALCARAAVLPILPIPQPYINDEFSHLLLADTLVHGRLANPPHPMWIHFETFHVIMQPTYSSMYPPGQGLALAVGKILTGLPFAGVWLSVAAMCAAICWMLQGWVPPGWALFGGLIAVMRLAVFSYWDNSYWGGAVAATGGALVLGALPRILRFARARDAFLMGLGLAVLANTRPYEGFVFSVPVACVLFVWFFRKRERLWDLSRSVLVPLLIVVVLAGLATGYYYWRVTGNPLRMAYQVDRETYAVAPYFLWQDPRPEPVYHHATMAQFYLHNELDFYKKNRTAASILTLEFSKLLQAWLFYSGPVLTLPLVISAVILPFGFRWSQLPRKTRFLIVASVVSAAGLAIEVFFFPHYASAMTTLFYGLMVLAMRHVRSWSWRGRPVGVALTRAVPVICLAMLALRAEAAPLHLLPTVDSPILWCDVGPATTDRVRLEHQLKQYPGQQLVLVRYKPGAPSTIYHSSAYALYDWVYNEADIDKSEVVWARDMGAAANQELIDYFSGRHVWLMQPDENPPRLSPYSLPAN